MTGNAVETATLGCLLIKIISQFNTATQFRMQLLDEVIINLPASYASNVQWTALPEGTKELLCCNYCALLLLGTAHALEEATLQLTHKIDEVLVLLNLDSLELDVIDGIKTTLHLSPRTLRRLQTRLTNSRIASHRWARVNESFQLTQTDNNLTYFDELIRRTVSNNNYNDESYLAELMKAGRSQYHNNVNEATEKISEMKIRAEDNSTQSTLNLLNTSTPTMIMEDNHAQPGSPKHETNKAIINQPFAAIHEQSSFFAVNREIAEAVRQYATQLNAIALETSLPVTGTSTTTGTTANVPTTVPYCTPMITTTEHTISKDDTTYPTMSKESSAALASTTPVKALFKEPLECSYYGESQKTKGSKDHIVIDLNTPMNDPHKIEYDGKTLLQLVHDKQYQYHWLQSLTGDPIPQWCPLGSFCGLTGYCHYMHPANWLGFPRDYRNDFEKYVKHANLIVKVDPYHIPRWSIPKIRIDAKLSVEYLGCWSGSKCPAVYNGECARMHPEATEAMAYHSLVAKRQELDQTEVNTWNWNFNKQK